MQGLGNLTQQLMARSQSSNVRKHHCRHCGRCVCANCSPRRVPIVQWGTGEERVCLQCEKLLAASADGGEPLRSSTHSHSH
jgi:hypothetical protein